MTAERDPLIVFPDRDSNAVAQAVAFARRWARDWVTWCICLEFILNEWGYGCVQDGWH